MQIPPLSVIQQWPTPNYVNPATIPPILIVVVLALIVITTITLALRLYTRQVISKGSGLDDILIILAYVPAVAFGALGIYGTIALQWNRHVWDVEPDLLSPGLVFGLAAQILFDIATSMTKLSMLALLYRVATAGYSRMKYLVCVLAGIIALNSLLFVLITIFQCSPVSDYWTFSLAPQICINEKAHLLAAGTINTVTDFTIVLLPIKTVAAIQLPKKQRLIVYLLFAGGFFASIAGAVRTYFTWQLKATPDYDITWNSYWVVLTSAIELFVGIICASLPATKPFFSRYLARFISFASPTNLNEPLALKRETGMKGSTAGGFSQGTYTDVEAGKRLPKSGKWQPAPHKTLTLAHLNKPLPGIKLEVDRTFTWEELTDPAPLPRGYYR